jgi:hypothetical protein
MTKIECRDCGCKMSTVTNTWTKDVKYHGKKRTIVRRRRVCTHCGLPFVTVETYEDDENPGMPDTGEPRPPKETPEEYRTRIEREMFFGKRKKK